MWSQLCFSLMTLEEANGLCMTWSPACSVAELILLTRPLSLHFQCEPCYLLHQLPSLQPLQYLSSLGQRLAVQPQKRADCSSALLKPFLVPSVQRSEASAGCSFNSDWRNHKMLRWKQPNLAEWFLPGSTHCPGISLLSLSDTLLQKKGEKRYHHPCTTLFTCIYTRLICITPTQMYRCHPLSLDLRMKRGKIHYLFPTTSILSQVGGSENTHFLQGHEDCNHAQGRLEHPGGSRKTYVIFFSAYFMIQISPLITL